MKLFGTEEPVPETPVLRAGPLECSLDAGNLRHIRLAGVEAIRAISYIVRDRNWGTYNPEISDLKIEQDAGGFRVTLQRGLQGRAAGLRLRGADRGRCFGQSRFAAEGEALSDFVTNRTGFVVLHPLEGVSGAPVEVERVDGSVEQSRFPELIDPTCPFMDIRTLTHEPLPGLRVACRMEGDTFEMEDQRNWLDASYKTYVRPLALPWPYTIAKGEKLSQRISLAVTGKPTRPGLGGADDAITVTIESREVGADAGRRPRRPGRPRSGGAGSDRAAACARPGPPRRRVRRPQGPRCRPRPDLRRARPRLGADLVLEVVLPCVDAEGKPTDDLEVLRRDLNYVKGQIERVAVRPARIAVSPASDLKCTLPGSVWPKAPTWEQLAAAARAAFPGIPLGGGMFSYFTELNRKRPPAGLFDFVGHTICPLVHACDDLSLTEGLEALPYIIKTTRSFAGEHALLAVSFDDRHAPEPLRRRPGREPAGGTRGDGAHRSARARPDRSRLVRRCAGPRRASRPRGGHTRRRRWPIGRARPRTAAPTRCTQSFRATRRCAASRCAPRAAARRARCRSRPWARRLGWST